MVEKVLFICVHNSARSQMAEAYFKQYAGNRAECISAGTQPGAGINPAVADVMGEAGIDMSLHKPKLLTPDMIESSTRVISMGCGVEVACPSRSIQTEDWALDDPSGRPLEEIRQIRDEIKRRVKKLVEDLGLS